MNNFLERNKSWLRLGIVLFYLIIVFLPGYVFFSQRGGFNFYQTGNFKTFASLIFPVFGLYAFTLVWAQTIIGMNMAKLTRVFPKVLNFHRTQGLFALLFAVTHAAAVPFIYTIQLYIGYKFLPENLRVFALLGTTAFFLMILAVLAALFRKTKFLQKYWRYIHIANYLVFILIFIHSRNLGSDIKNTILNQLWYFFLLTFLVSLFFRIKRVSSRRQVSST